MNRDTCGLLRSFLLRPAWLCGAPSLLFAWMKVPSVDPECCSRFSGGPFFKVKFAGLFRTVPVGGEVGIPPSSELD